MANRRRIATLDAKGRLTQEPALFHIGPDEPTDMRGLERLVWIDTSTDPHAMRCFHAGPNGMHSHAVGGSTTGEHTHADITAALATHAQTAHGLSSHALDGAYHAGTDVLPTPGQKNALAGTQGTPGTNNPYVTTQDARLSDARTPATHSHAEADVTGLVADLASKAPSVHAHAYAATSHAHAITDTTGLQMALDGKAASDHTHAGAVAPVLCRKAADQAFSTTTFNDSTGMALGIAAAGTYAFEFHIFFTTSAATVGIKLGVNGPAQTALRFGVQIGAAAPAGGGSAILHSGAGAAYNAEALAATAGPGASPSYAVVSGSLVATATGTLQLRHGSETATATTILAGSWGRLTRIA